MMDRNGINAWLMRLLSHENDADARRAIYGAVALMTAPSHFRASHFVRLTFVHGHDDSDASGQLRDEYRCEMRFSRNAVTARWWHDVVDSICDSSVHEKGQLRYTPTKHRNFQSFIEDIEGKVVMGKIAKCSCKLGHFGIESESCEKVIESGGTSLASSVGIAVDLGDAEDEFMRLASQMW